MFWNPEAPARHELWAIERGIKLDVALGQPRMTRLHKMRGARVLLGEKP